MKSIKTLIMLFIFAYSINFNSQVVYNSYIDSLTLKVSIDSLTKTVLELSGELETVIGGQDYRLISRRWSDPGNQKAAEYINERFQRLGLQTRMQAYDSGGVNVIGKKTGIKYPNQYFLVGAHYDDILVSSIISDTVPGADDDGSGIAAMLEIARILSPLNLDYTVIFVAFDEEEYGGFNNYNGSMAYADTAFIKGDSLVCALILDVISWDGNNDNRLCISSDSNSGFYSRFMFKIIDVYQPSLVANSIYPLSGDAAPFWAKGYAAILPTEHNSDYNPFMHTLDDRYNKFNLPYYEKMVKADLSFISSLSLEYYINYFSHTPVSSGPDTSSKITAVVIRSHFPLSRGANRPRLYFKERLENSFSFVYPFYSSNDTFKFEIPGKPPGSSISYYFAAQDSSGNIYGTWPPGGAGINPPGTVPPDTFFSYYVYDRFSICSGNLPVNINPLQFTVDTINIDHSRIITDVDLNLTLYHSNDGDLLISLMDPNGISRSLSVRNGGSGDNYINTAFDDEASDSIKHGTPPFTGSFIPDNPLRDFDNNNVLGAWKIRIFNYSTNITGHLVSWCLNFQYYNPIGIVNNQIPVKSSLSQNYPNPFNSSTKINFTISKQSHVRVVVYDILGREVTVLVNTMLNYGEHNLSLDANNLSSGLYFYSMYLDGGLFETKKMVLVK